MDREFDIIVYGASGFTARYVIKDLMETNLKVVLSGRSEEKIKKNIGYSKTDKSFPIILSSVEDLPNLTKRGKVLLNCAGPFLLCGEGVVKACLSTGTHYVDITGEPFFVENMIKKYHDEAQEKKVLLVPCCGFDSIPADIGIMFLKKVLDSQPVWSRSYLELQDTYINHTTYDTVIHSLSNMGELRNLRKTEKKRLDNEDKKKSDGEGTKKIEIVERDRLRKLPFYSELTQSYCMMFLGSDASIVKRSQQLLKEKDLGAPIQYGAYFSVGSLLSLCMFLFWLLAFYVIALCKCGREMLMKYPEIFTLGKVRTSGPTEEMLEKSKFKMSFEGMGVKKNDGSDKLSKHYVTTCVSGPDPGYISTPICVTTCATLLVDMVNGKWKSYFEGGILTPAAAFNGSDIIERLKKKGINFEVIGQKTDSSD